MYIFEKFSNLWQKWANSICTLDWKSYIKRNMNYFVLHSRLFAVPLSFVQLGSLRRRVNLTIMDSRHHCSLHQRPLSWNLLLDILYSVYPVINFDKSTIWQSWTLGIIAIFKWHFLLFFVMETFLIFQSSEWTFLIFRMIFLIFLIFLMNFPNFPNLPNQLSWFGWIFLISQPKLSEDLFF